MEKSEGKSENHVLTVVEVPSKTRITDKIKDIKRSLEDTNRNLTILPPVKKDLILGEILETTETLSELSLDEPKRRFNGVENENIENVSRAPSENCTVRDCSSHWKSCVNASDVLRGDSSSTDSTSHCNHKGFSDSNKVPEEDRGRLAAASNDDPIEYVSYESELQMPDIMSLIQKDLSEPYSIYTYRYFIHNWPQLCFLAMSKNTCVGAIVCKLDIHRKVVKRGYIAMLAVDEKYRKKKIGSNLVLKAIRAMVSDGADEVVLETEITNKPALRLYENLGFVRDKRLFRYYLNGVDALRLKLWLR